MKEWMEANAGLYRRITKQFTFADYTPREIAQLTLAQLIKWWCEHYTL